MVLAAGLVIWAGCGSQDVFAPSSQSGDPIYAPMGKGGNGGGGGGGATDTTTAPPDTTDSTNGSNRETNRFGPGDGTADW